MSNYSKTTDFEAKDSLPTGDSGKIIRGAEFETEFDAISTAIATKADTAGPTFTGTLTFETISDGTIGVTAFVDEDDMSSDSATLVPTQQSVKAYVDSQVTAQDLDFQADTGGALSIDLDSETLTFTGGTGIDTSGSGNAVTFAIDSTVATLTGTQTLTNKTLTSPDVNTPDIDGGTIDGTVIGGTTAAAGSFTTVSATGNITVDGTVDGRDVATDGTKLDTVETNADVTDTANVTAAGALMDSELTSEASVKALNQGVATTDSPTFAGVTVNGTVEFDGLSGTGAVSVTDILDQDDMSSNSATALATQQSIKAYVDSQVATADTLSEVLANGNTTGGTDIAVGTGDDITFADNSKAIFGAGSDLQIYHDASLGQSRIQDVGTGSLYLQGDGGVVITNSAGTSTSATFASTGATSLSFNGATKFATTSTGIDVTGTVTADGLTVNTGSGTFDIEQYGSSSAGLNASNFLKIEAGSVTPSGAIQLFTNSAERLNIAANGDISFYEDTGTTAKLFWDASAERLGLGTSSPETNLHIEDSSSFSIIRLVASTTENAGIDFGDPDDRDIGRVRYNNSDNSMVFHTNAAEQMRIDSSGNVGIGVTPESWFSSYTALDTGATTSLYNFSTNSGLAFNSYDDGNWKYKTTAYAGRSFYHTGDGYFAWYNAASGTADTTITWSEAMRIDSSGNLLVGTTSLADVDNKSTAHLLEGASSLGGRGAVGVYNNSGTANCPALVVLNLDASTDTSNRFIQFYADVSSSGSTAMGGIVGNGASNVQFAALSDAREKTNIQSISGSLTKINSLNPVEFDWIASGEHVNAGFVAQEVEQVFPEFVVANMAEEGAEERKGLTGGMTGGIVAHLVKAIQEQNELINDLRARVAQLEGEN